MTYREWMSATTSRFNMSDQDINLVFVNQNIDPEEEVDVKKAKIALCREFASVIPIANISEGGYSISWNMDAVKLWYQQMCNELGIAPIGMPSVRNRSNRW